jgi:hypothetical protein
MVPRDSESADRDRASSATYLLVLGDRAALAWVLKHERMAFPDYRRAETRALKLGDRLLLYTTRGCFRNPTRDRGRVIGEAVVTSKLIPLDQAVVISGRTYPVGCKISVKRLAALHEGVILRDLVPDLDAFPNKETWAIRLRRPLVSLSAHDADLLSARLAPLVGNPKETVVGYLRWL